jgi:hypothetical protein
MTGPNPGVRPATEDDHEAAAEALAPAFADDPAWAHLLPTKPRGQSGFWSSSQPRSAT